MGGLTGVCAVLAAMPQIVLDSPKKADIKHNRARHDGDE